jgi:hypothetical protein
VAWFDGFFTCTASEGRRKCRAKCAVAVAGVVAAAASGSKTRVLGAGF